MKKTFMIAIVVGLFALNQKTVADSLSVSFTSMQISGHYSPERDVVVYILNAAGAFVRTLGYWGADRKDCRTWATISNNNVVDAISSATVSGPSSNLSTSWNGKDVSKQPVSNGTYWLCIEGTASDSNLSAPRLKCKIVLDGTSKTSTVADSSLNNGSTYLTALSVFSIGNGGAVRPPVFTAMGKNRMFSFLLGRSRVAVLADGEETIAVELFTLRGEKAADRVLLARKDGAVGRGLFQSVHPGMYTAKVTSRYGSVQRTVLFAK
jgi:hypothetical protein